MSDPRPLTGEPLCLDLLNTYWIGENGPEDLLDSTDGVGVWLHSAGLADRAVANEATRGALRETREVLRALVDGEAGRDAARELNLILERGALRYRLGAAGPEARGTTDDPAWLPAWLAATDYLGLVDGKPERIKRCAAHPKCVLHFYDTTKNGTRRWCSMAGCGNRAKAARHYERERAGSG
ncbi:CGNR zinc finger domain-containing protein [Amycolatopsis tucumanensis]|uniref:CGNR zinc finger domain-containing protein n=1 Tax=Amycolatopsis tucumanensis TaxID=401106 RepID=A0ABP7J728_9PSEU|nr:CGNR zinc finger domain-containing protein [Amycolatopsis tucumanensis]MCF6427883.1 CGNR zinc finger domain-containing protein [Amycolatopsis tucumanensis]